MFNLLAAILGSSALTLSIYDGSTTGIIINAFFLVANSLVVAAKMRGAQ